MPIQPFDNYPQTILHARVWPPPPVTELESALIGSLGKDGRIRKRAVDAIKELRSTERTVSTQGCTSISVKKNIKVVQLGGKVAAYLHYRSVGPPPFFYALF